jgi:tRNA dimethylallyltransferase
VVADDRGAVPLTLPTPRAVVAVVGPTASGKTEVAELLALDLPGEIVSADSMQVYRGMDIGTAKPAPGERLVPYHCLDLVDPGEAYSAARFQRDAREAITSIAARGSWPVVTGGTGLYVRAALDDMAFPPGERDSVVRGRYEDLARQLGPQALHDLLAERDPASARLLHPNNVRRVVRALEMLDQGRSYADQASRFSERESIYDACIVGLRMDRERLYARVDARVDDMISGGLVEEVARLLQAGYRHAVTAAQAIGYKELVPVLEEGADLDAAVAEIKRATRRYAKRQMSWFDADPRVAWLDVTDLTPVRAAEAAHTLVESFARTASAG